MSVTADAARPGETPGAREDYSARLCPAANALLPPGGRVVSLVASDAVRLRAAFWSARAAAPRGTVTILPGRAEFIEKYGEVVDELLARGFAVAPLDLRGQGGSQRELADPQKGHVDDFAQYALDLAALETALLAPHAPRPWFGLAHSMAACACLLAARAQMLPFERLVATAPLVQIYTLETARLPRLLAASLDALGLGGAYIPGGDGGSAMLKPFPGNPLARDPRRYARHAAPAPARSGRGGGGGGAGPARHRRLAHRRTGPRAGRSAHRLGRRLLPRRRPSRPPRNRPPRRDADARASGGRGHGRLLAQRGELPVAHEGRPGADAARRAT